MAHETFPRRFKEPYPESDFAIPFNQHGGGFTDVGLTTGTLVLGAPGSGKSAGPGTFFRRALLRRGYGFMVLTVKPGEAAKWIADAKACGREKDIIHVVKGGLAFDPLAYEMRRSGSGAGDTNSLVDIISTLSNVGRPMITSNGDDSAKFFRNSNEQVQRAEINVLKPAGKAVSLVNIRSVINSLPDMPIPEDVAFLMDEMKSWMERSYAGQLVTRIADRRNDNLVADEDWRAAEFAIDFLTSEWPGLAPETRTSIEQTFSSTCDKLLAPPYDMMLCSGKCAYVPEQVFFEGKIIILDIPTVEHGKSAELLQIANKLAFQKAIARRNVDLYPRYACLFADEFQVFCISQDTEFQEICRESRCCAWYATQNLQNLAKRLHEHRPGAGTLSLISNIGNRILMQNGGTDFTNKWAAESFGKVFEMITTSGPGGPHTGPQERYLVHPEEFIRLQRPNPQALFAAAFIYSDGRAWKATGKTYLPHVFKLN